MSTSVRVSSWNRLSRQKHLSLLLRIGRKLNIWDIRYLELKLEDGQDVLFVVIDLACPLEAGLKVGLVLVLKQLVDGRPRGDVLAEVADLCWNLLDDVNSLTWHFLCEYGPWPKSPNKIVCWCLDSNRERLISEAIAVPIAPQPLPFHEHRSLCLCSIPALANKEKSFIWV